MVRPKRAPKDALSRIIFLISRLNSMATSVLIPTGRGSKSSCLPTCFEIPSASCCEPSLATKGSPIGRSSVGKKPSSSSSFKGTDWATVYCWCRFKQGKVKERTRKNKR
eukprot:scaffold199094_cov26-Attheya_sp.AAC.1